jgi:hypothetical protein
MATAACGGTNRLAAYPREIHALGLAENISNSDLIKFAAEECAAAKAARSNQDAPSLMKFKANHVGTAFARFDQVAIELFRVLFVATGHLVCPEYDPVIVHSSAPLF